MLVQPAIKLIRTDTTLDLSHYGWAMEVTTLPSSNSCSTKAESEAAASSFNKKISYINSKLNALMQKGIKKPKRYSYVLTPEKWFKGTLTEVKKSLKTLT